MALKTDYVNDVLDTSINTERTYNLVDANGNVIYEGVKIRETTALSTTGDNYGAIEINEQNETINENSDAIEQINSDLTATNTAISNEVTARQNGDSAKVNKSGDTMTGNLTINGKDKRVLLQYRDGSVSRDVYVGYSSSNGNFYLYDATVGSSILMSPKSGNPTFNGCDIKNMRARMPIYGTTYGRGAIADALSVNLNSPDGDENRVGYVYTGYTNSLPSDCAHGIREVFYYNSSSIYIQITGVTSSGEFRIWGNFYNGSSWVGWRCP